MVSRSIVAAAVLLWAVAAMGGSCKVTNEDHCANQAEPGNDFCRALSEASPYCSPCRREFHGCVANPPYSCGGYYDELGEEELTSTGTAGATMTPGSDDMTPGSDDMTPASDGMTPPASGGMATGATTG
nr:hypothetical protein [Deltaproteobacteria bacterium]